MSVAVDAPPPPAPSAIQQLARVLPGIVLLGIVGYAGKITEQSIAAYGRAHHLTLPNIEYVLWAIIFGLVVLQVALAYISFAAPVVGVLHGINALAILIISGRTGQLGSETAPSAAGAAAV